MWEWAGVRSAASACTWQMEVLCPPSGPAGSLDTRQSASISRNLAPANHVGDTVSLASWISSGGAAAYDVRAGGPGRQAQPAGSGAGRPLGLGPCGVWPGPLSPLGGEGQSERPGPAPNQAFCGLVAQPPEGVSWSSMGRKRKVISCDLTVVRRLQCRLAVSRQEWGASCDASSRARGTFLPRQLCTWFPVLEFLS